MDKELALRTFAYLIGYYKTHEETIINSQEIEAINYILDENERLETQLKKQKAVIDKANKYLHTRGIQRCYNGRHYRGLDGLQVQVLEDILKEVSE